jgi:HK97 family phage major capsid protein
MSDSVKEFTETQLDFEVRGESRYRDLAREDRAAMKAAELGLIRARLSTSVTGHLSRAADRVADAGASAMSAENWAAFSRSVRNVAQSADLDRRLAKLQTRYEKRAAGPRVVKEPRVYGPDSPGNSYFLDLATAVRDGVDFQDAKGAQGRLKRYSAELGYEVRRGSKEGRRVERLIGEQTRQADPAAHSRVAGELRAVVSGGGATAAAASGAAAFVTPAYIEQLWGPYIQRSPFVNAVTTQDIPEFGLNIYLPVLSSDAGVAQQATENTALAETDPSAAYLSSSVETIAGKVIVSQELYDRGGGPGGVLFDQVVAKQLAIDWARSVDSFALTTALATAGSVPYNGTFALAGTSGVGGFVDKLASAKNAIRGTAGAYLEPSAAFFAPARWEYMVGWADAQGRPVVLPCATGDNPRKYGDTGLEWGGLHIFTDPNVPAVGTTSEDQVVVLDPSEVYVWRSPQPIVNAFSQTGANALEVTIRIHGYAGCIVRYQSGVQTVFGTAFSTPSF